MKMKKTNNFYHDPDETTEFLFSSCVHFILMNLLSIITLRKVNIIENKKMIAHKKVKNACKHIIR